MKTRTPVTLMFFRYVRLCECKACGGAVGTEIINVCNPEFWVFRCSECGLVQATGSESHLEDAAQHYNLDRLCIRSYIRRYMP